MRHDFLDRYSRIDSPVHRLPAAIKLLAALAAVLATVAAPPSMPWLMAPTAIFLLAAAAVSRLPWRFLAVRMLTLEPLVCGVAAMALFQPGGWRLMLILVAKCSLCLFAVVLLSNTTAFSDLLRVLKAVRVPGLLVTTMALAYRYLFVLVDEAQRMKRARLSRTFVSGRAGAWRAAATVIGQLFARATERAERIYAAMCARGWR